MRTNHFPTTEELRAMSLVALRNLDIMDGDEEVLVQGVINEKVLSSPLQMDVYTGDVPDITDGETEAKWQKILDERREAARQRVIRNSATVPVAEVPVEAPLEESQTQSEAIGIQDAFFCVEHTKQFKNNRAYLTHVRFGHKK